MQWRPKAEHAIYHIYAEGNFVRRAYTCVREERSGLACRAYVTELLTANYWPGGSCLSDEQRLQDGSKGPGCALDGHVMR